MLTPTFGAPDDDFIDIDDDDVANANEVDDPAEFEPDSRS
jgi:hypothetical protein